MSAITTEPCLLLVSRHDTGGARVLGLSGECDLATRHQLENALAQALSARGPDPLILDLAGLEFCDVGCTRMVCEAGGQGRVALVGLSGIVGKVFGLLDPDHRVPRYDDVSDALASFASDGGNSSVESDRPCPTKITGPLPRPRSGLALGSAPTGT